MNRIKELRTALGMKQVELAKLVKVSQNTVSNWEHGKHDPDQDALRELSQIFGTSIDYILGNSDIKKAPSLEDAGLSAEEAELLKLFRAAPSALQDAALRVLEANQRKE